MKPYTVEFHSFLTVEATSEDEALNEAQRLIGAEQDGGRYPELLSADYELSAWKE